MINIKKLSVSILALGLFVLPGFAQDHSQMKFDCSLCHSCETPTKSNPCLIKCPREKMMTVHIPPEKSPKIIEMHKLKVMEDLYEAVIFSHRAHAEMSEISGGCEMCHHYNPPGNIVACNYCHDLNRQRTDISKPDLKGAYHRQCIDCHSEWSQEVACESCHELNASGKSAFSGKEYSKERIHPVINVPTKLIYNTSEQNGSLVTFFHNEHNDLYGLECKHCHHEESCTKCHAVTKPFTKKEISAEERHKKCMCASCHDTADKTGCESCHTKKELEPFNHKIRTGFELKSYHAELSCSRCHQTKAVFTGLISSCTSCHSGWNSNTFDHKITGLDLDDIHLEFDCGDCHIGEDFLKSPSCENCHDDLAYPDFKPGKLVK
ncbi:MAG: cytochrome c3 family protein [Ignavibacteriaceae bacterium]